uniref:Uncharacterized protein n=1 Tax=Triticum urartu TaxID=4572 RepID=A0A8R7UG72_TRIUA
MKLTRLASPALLRPLHRAAARDRAPRPLALTSPGPASPRPSAHLVLPLSRPAAAHRPGQGPLCEAPPSTHDMFRPVAPMRPDACFFFTNEFAN